MITLTSIVLKNSKRTDNPSKKKINWLSIIAFFIVFGTISSVMIYFSYYVTKQLIAINQPYIFINILLLMNFVILFLKSIFESLNVLYFSKDLKLFLRMPIKPSDILHAKFINMIISEYEMEILMLAIPMVVYGILTHAGALFYLYMVLILLILPVIPIIITSIVVAIIMRFTNWIKDKNMVTYITIFISFAVYALITLNFNTSTNIEISLIENLIFKANGLAESLADKFVLIKPIMNTLINYSNVEGLKNFLIFAIENILFYVLGVFIISKIYLKGAIGATVNSKRKSNIANNTLNITDFMQRSVINSYLHKEILTLRRTPIFCLQCLIMPIIYPISVLFVIIVFFQFAKMLNLDLFSMLNELSITSLGTSIYLIVGQLLYMMNFNSVIAVSRDSKYSKLIKYLPISLSKQFRLKLSLGIKINLITAVFVSVCNYIFTKNILSAIILFSILMLLNYMGEAFKLLIDLRKPKINWTSEYTMMKENTNVMYILFYTLIVAGIIFGISKIVASSFSYLLVILFITIVATVFLNKFIEKNQEKIFSKIY